MKKIETKHVFVYSEYISMKPICKRESVEFVKKILWRGYVYLFYVSFLISHTFTNFTFPTPSLIVEQSNKMY